MNIDDPVVLKESPMVLTDKNLFTYCDNNPITRTDDDGEFWETAFDIVSLSLSIVDVAKNPSDPWAWAGLVGDAVDLVPFVTGAGEIVKSIKVAKKAAETIDTLHDAGNGLEIAGDVARKVDFYVTPMGDAIPATKKGFISNLSKMDNKNGKFIGQDSRGSVRIRIEKHDATPNYNGPYNPYHCEPHFHIDRRKNGNSGGFVKTFTGLLEWFR